jgi:hypothetical protein
MYEGDGHAALATAAATRFTGPNRTSPQAKMPGTVVSRPFAAGPAPDPAPDSLVRTFPS